MLLRLSSAFLLSPTGPRLWTQAQPHSAGPQRRHLCPHCSSAPSPLALASFPRYDDVRGCSCWVTMGLTLLECRLAKAGPPQALFTVCPNPGLRPCLLGREDVPVRPCPGEKPCPHILNSHPHSAARSVCAPRTQDLCLLEGGAQAEKEWGRGSRLLGKKSRLG